MNIYLMRHGKTIYNEKGITQGRIQNRLSKQGKIDANNAAQKLKNIKLDFIIVSPLMRTMQTANIVNQFHNVKLIKDERITEIDQGVFTGRNFASLSEEEKKLKKARSKKCGMESFFEVYERLLVFVKDILKTHKGKTFLIVTHKICADFISKIINNVEYDDDIYKELTFKNAEIRKFVIED